MHRSCVVGHDVKAAVHLVVLGVCLLVQPRSAAPKRVSQLGTIGLPVVALEHLEDQRLAGRQGVYSNRRSTVHVVARQREIRLERGVIEDVLGVGGKVRRVLQQLNVWDQTAYLAYRRLVVRGELAVCVHSLILSGWAECCGNQGSRTSGPDESPLGAVSPGR